MISKGKPHALWIATSALVTAVIIIWGLVLLAYRAEQISSELALIRAGVTSLKSQLQSTGGTGTSQGNTEGNVEMIGSSAMPSAGPTHRSHSWSSPTWSALSVEDSGQRRLTS
jgi:hypothetical protein